MEKLRLYILSVVCAALFLSILQSTLRKQGNSAILIRLVGGLFLAIVIIKPIFTLDLSNILTLPLDYAQLGNRYARQGNETSRLELESIIREQCEAYILDKASSYQMELEVEVVLSQDDLPQPEAVTLKGAVSPYQRQLLQSWLENQMGIQGAFQIWIG